MENTINILLADSQYLTSMGLRYLLSSNKSINVVGVASNRNELLEKIDELNPHIVILDYHNQDDFFDLNDIELTCPKAKVLIISADKNKQNIYKVLNFGIYGFLTKSCKEQEILDAINSIHSQKRFFCQSVLDLIVEKQMSDDNTSIEKLTKRELDILGYIAKGFTTKEIAAHLFLSHHTVNTHRKNMMKKLNVNSATELLSLALREGILNFK